MTISRNEGMPGRIRIVVADDHAMIREGLRNLFGMHPEMKVIGEASTGRDAIQMSLNLEPDVVVLGVTLKSPGSIETIREILAHSERIKIVVISMQADQDPVESILKAGASGYLARDSSFEELTTAVLAVLQGQSYLTPGITKTVIQGYLNMSAVPARQGALSKRQCEVLRHIGEGMGTREIAENLSLSINTVETYRRRIMEKLGIFSMAGLIKYAIREKYTSL
ncbi:MAG: DNA-binding response regulator [Desulfobacteraceae bacterium]|nr:MAG: DNA-binding response regulator [Desulfobacteraceae bacterium]